MREKFLSFDFGVSFAYVKFFISKERHRRSARHFFVRRTSIKVPTVVGERKNLDSQSRLRILFFFAYLSCHSRVE